MAQAMEPELVEFFASLLKEALEESSAAEDGPLPSSFCKALLRPDPCDHSDCVGRLNAAASGISDPCMVKFCCRGEEASLEGIPVYPLFQHLARVISACILLGHSKALPGFSELCEDSSLKEKMPGWLERVEERGSAIEKVVKCLDGCYLFLSFAQAFQAVDYRLHVQDEFYGQLKDGSKTVEGRCATGSYCSIEPGNILLFNSSLLLQVKEVKSYSSFAEMLEAEGLHNVLPGYRTIPEGVGVYRRFYTEEVERQGVLAIHISKPPFVAPRKHLDALLCDIHTEGVMSLLGMRFTKGTVAPSVPPPRSAILLSFQLRHVCAIIFLNSRFHVILFVLLECSASVLTAGARALAKHVNRSSTRWWGECSGPDTMKNKTALAAVCRMINAACWMNVHRVTHAVHVFELRVREGYGARWSADGAEFRGFLEPPMPNGHANKWRH